MTPDADLALVVDIETVSLEDASDFLEPPTAPVNYRDPLKIATYLEERRAELLERCALDPDLCRIVALGWQLEERDSVPTVITCRDDHEEREALRRFWHEVALDANRTRRLVTFNGFSFDLPVVMRRSVYLDLWPPRYLNVDKYRSPHVDLLLKLTFNGAIKPHSLAFYGKRFNLPVELQAPELDGAAIARLVAQGDWDSVRAHCADDVQLTFALAERLRYLQYDEDRETPDEVVGF